ncbi:OmpA family protein [Psychrobacter phenylpyruvicus]|uniref:Photosystem I P700 chlorophyll a apoprotein A2 n=1 Tax=Psychrobacter phenylpyruvicus TaxID=29432 RepID=A0A379LM75_9GAMM|nr:OmpA family protein [Psychrobacter phenylpyruvicus]SUD91719.1 Photosystem I P700 chlorophyll a apoprotein A2 [Psychrobacter phenylpyruvicus]
MDIIGHLARTVTPAVLGDNHSPQNESLLKQFYALFAAKLADNDSFNRLGTQEINREDLGLFDRLWTDEAQKTEIANELAAHNNVEVISVKGLLASAAPLAFNEIKSLAGSTPIPQFLRENLNSFRDHIPTWATAVLPAGLLGAGAAGAAHVANTNTTPNAAAHANTAGHRISDTTSTAPLQREEKESGGFLKALLPIIGLIILAALAWALLKGCQKDPAPVATPEQTMEQPAETAVTGNTELDPAVLTLATGSGNELFACRITAGNQDLGNTVTTAVKDVFGAEADDCRAEVYSNVATDMPAAAHLGAILPLVKNTPNANVIIEGNDVRIDAPDQAQLDKLVADIKAAAPELNVIAAGPLDLDAEIEQSIADSTAAMNKLGDNPNPNDVARALSLQVINFEVDKADIPEVNKAVLDRAVEVMKNVPEMELMILGHTDSDGDDAYNKELSQRRAEAVKAYLVSKGADASKLMTKGMGETDPIATNETENGKFRNRRIEFTVYDETAMGTQEIEVTQDAANVAETTDVEMAKEAEAQ